MVQKKEMELPQDVQEHITDYARSWTASAPKAYWVLVKIYVNWLLSCVENYSYMYPIYLVDFAIQLLQLLMDVYYQHPDLTVTQASYIILQISSKLLPLGVIILPLENRVTVQIFNAPMFILNIDSELKKVHQEPQNAQLPKINKYSTLLPESLKRHMSNVDFRLLQKWISIYVAKYDLNFIVLAISIHMHLKLNRRFDLLKPPFLDYKPYYFMSDFPVKIPLTLCRGFGSFTVSFIRCNYVSELQKWHSHPERPSKRINYSFWNNLQYFLEP
jgi:hypothetical protein